MRSLYNPFSPLRYMNLWEVAAFKDDDGGGTGGSDDNDNQTTTTTTTATPTVNNYDNIYDAIDAEGVGATVSINGQEMAAVAGDGYQGSSSSDDSSSSSTYGMSPGQASAMGQGYQGGDTVGAPSGASSYDSGMSDYEQAAYGTTQEDFYNNQATTDTDSGSTYDEIPTATQINAASGFTDDDEDYTPTSAELNAAIDAIGGVNLTDPEYAVPVDFTTTASGQDYNTVAEADTDESGFQYVADIDPVTGENTTGSTLASNEPVSVAPPVDTTPVVAPVYTDSAGVEHSTQAAADAADAQYAEAARLEAERIEAESEAERIQALINQVVTQDSAQDSAQNVTAAPVAEDADLGAAIEAAEAFDAYTKGLTIPDDAPITYDGNQQLGASGQLDDGRYDFVDDLPDDRFDFVDETEALLAELGVDVDLLGDNTDTGINLESYDDANDFVETPVTDLQKVQDLVDSGVDRSLAQAVVESGGTPGEPAGIDKYDFGFDGGIKGTETAPSVITDLALGSDDGSTIEADIAATFMPRETFGDVVLGGGTDDESYTPTSAELEAQLAEQGLTNITPGPLSVEDQIAQYDTGDLSGVNLDLRDIGRGLENDLSADLAMEGLINTGALDDTILDLSFDLTDNDSLKNSDGTNFTGQYRGTSYVDGQPDTDADNIDLMTTAEGTDTGGATTSTSGTTDATGTEAYLSAMAKIEDRDPNAKDEVLTLPEQYALYGARGQTPNAAESAYLNDLLSDATHKEDVINPDTGAVIAKAGDKVTAQSFGEKVEDGIVSFIDTFLNPLSIFGEKFTIGGANAAKVEAQLEAYKNGGTFVYGEDGKTVVGVASPNFDASGDGNLDTVVLYDESGNKTVTGDGIAVTDVIDSNKFTDTDSEKFDIDIVKSVKTYENTEDGVVEELVGVVEEDNNGDDDNFIICEEGFEFDPVEGICMPIAGVGDGTGTGGTTIGTDKRDRTDPVIVRPEQPTVGALKVRGAKQFAQGGMVTSNIDNFVQSLRG